MASDVPAPPRFHSFQLEDLPGVARDAVFGALTRSESARACCVSTGWNAALGAPHLWSSLDFTDAAAFGADTRAAHKEERCAVTAAVIAGACAKAGAALRDVTPEATLAVADKEMPGFGEQMRQISLKFVPTAILSRQVAVIRGQSLIINLPGQPKSIAETLEGLKVESASASASGQQVVHGIFAAVPYCVDLIGGPYIETRDEVCKAFRPKSATRPR